MTNVLMITIDCLRADCLGYMGYERPISPHIDYLAEQSTTFTQAFATGPRTAESFPGILASTYPMTFGARFSLPDDCLTLAEVLQSSDYATAAYHSNPFLSANLGYAKGFDFFWDSFSKTPVTSKMGAKVMPRMKHQSLLYRLLRRLIRYYEVLVGISHFVRAEEITEMAIRWLHQQSRSFFLWVHYMDMHQPYAPPTRHIRKVRPEGVKKHRRAALLVRALEKPHTLSEGEIEILRDLYDAGLSYVDENLGALLESLEQIGILEDTIIILTADHGEEFLEHGELGHGTKIQALCNGRARIRLYDELLRVPLIFWVRNASTRPKRIPALTSLVDIAPTVVDLLGLEKIDRWHGTSLVPLLRGETGTVRGEVFSEYAVQRDGVRCPIVSCRTAKWKYIYDGGSGYHELYDLEKDPTEKHNLYGAGISVLPALQRQVREHLALEQPSSPSVAEPELSPEVIERLKGLGYIE